MSNNILIVEPNQAINSEMSNRLRSFGFSVQSAESIAAAIDVAAVQRPDLLVLDHCLMDQSQGLNPGWANGAALVVIANDGNPNALKDAQHAGASNLLTQPFSSNDLLDSVSDALWRDCEAANDASY